MFICIYGNPCDGFRFVGPFENRDDARKYVEGEPQTENWWISELDVPAEKGRNAEMRIDQLTDYEKRVAAKILLDRQIHMLFGGEEWSLTEAEEETYWVIFRKLGGKL